MSTAEFHIPGMPQDMTPPAELERAADTPAPEGVVQLGLTTTTDGEWALLARISSHVHAPVDAVERLAHGHPVIYETASGILPVARPAYPADGE